MLESRIGGRRCGDWPTGATRRERGNQAAQDREPLVFSLPEKFAKCNSSRVDGRK